MTDDRPPADPEPRSAAPQPGDRLRGLLLAANAAKARGRDHGGRDHGGDTGRGQDRDEAPEDDDRPVGVLLMDSMGGRRGLVDTTLPTIVFIVANTVGGLRAGVVAAIACALLLVAERLIRRESQQQAWSGLFGVALAAFIASRMHRAEGFFLPGIAKNAIYGVVCAGSLLVRRPLIGYVLAAFDRRYADWRTEPRLRRAAWWGTALWVSVFAVRVVVQGSLYLAHRPGWLAASNLAMGWPLFAVALVGCVALARRAAPAADDADDPPAAQSELSPTGTPPSKSAS